MNESEKNIQISAAGLVSDEYHEKIEQAEEGQWVAYLDLMGTSVWFEDNKTDPNLNKKVKDRYGKYLATIWKNQKPVVEKISVHPIGDSLIIIPKLKAKLDIEEFLIWLSMLWMDVADQEQMPKILITKARYQSVRFNKGSEYKGNGDWYPFLIFPGGLSAAQLNFIDKNLNVPSGVYSNHSHLEKYKLCFVEAGDHRAGKWFCVAFWEPFPEQDSKTKAKKYVAEFAESYSQRKEPKSLGKRNAERIIEKMQSC